MTETLSPEPSDPTAVDPEGAIADIRARRAEPDAPKRGRGRPKGTGKGKSARKSAAEPDAADGPPPEVTETDIAGAAMLGGMVWGLVGKIVGMRALEKSESRELGEALAPVLAKYLPLLNEYAAEATLAVVVFGLWERTKIEKPTGSFAVELAGGEAGEGPES